MKLNPTPEEAVIELRNIVKGLGGLDPMYGRVTKPIERISEEDTERFLNALFTSRKGATDGT